jgi:zinc protease
MRLLRAAILACGLIQAQDPAALKFPPLGPVHIPKVETYTMRNGIRVYLLENHELPLVNGIALVRTGGLFDPPDKIGLASLTGSVMRSGGTQAKTGDQLNQELENMAASVESWIGDTAGEVSFSALSANTPQVLGAFRGVIREPAFRQDKIDLAKMQIRSSISRRNDNPDGIASREFSKLIYGRNTPYGAQVEYDTIGRITRDDLVAFHRRYYFPANIMLAVYGDFDSAGMKARLGNLFGDWNDSQPPVPPFPKVERRPSPGVYVATKTDVNQTVFFVGQIGGELRDKDDPALEVMGDILGGGFASRLFRRVRTELGYAYEVSAAWSASYDYPGVFEIAGSTKSASTADALAVIRQEVDRLRTSEVSGEELRTAKETVLNSFVFNFDRPSKTLSRMLQYEYYGYPPDFIFQYQKAVAAVTKSDVLRVAKQYLKPEQFTIVAVGNPAEFGKPLASLGLPVHPLDITIPNAEPAVSPAEAQRLP